MIQMGARRHYAYTRQLEQAGLLHSFITDAAWANKHHWMPKTIGAILPSKKSALARRIVPMRDPARLEASLLPNVMSVPWPGMAREWRYARSDDLLGRVASRRFDDSVRVVVNYFGNGGFFLEQAKSRGALIVTDFISHPFFWDAVAEERRRWPGWEDNNDQLFNRDAYVERIRKMVALSDIYCCPALSIADALSRIDGFDEKKVRLLPYGAPLADAMQAKPLTGRVLCAASSFSLAKGLPYLAQAASLVKSKHPQAEFVVAGYTPHSVRNRPELGSLTFLGSLGKGDMSIQFAQADMFCLPTLAEGSATVIFEAMSLGIPCITTASCGSVITGGVDGLIVPERDAEATAGAICQLIENRAWRNDISTVARKTALRYSDTACGDAFVEMIASLPRKDVIR